jgi:hypothetical protein
MARPALVVRAEADTDVRGAVRWYEAQAPGLRREVRRALLRRFPYAFYFTLEAEATIVLACLHVRRDPAEWQGRR